MTAGEVPHILFQDKTLWRICVEGADEIIGCAVYLLTSIITGESVLGGKY